jgi:hypothetical protein
VWCGAAVFVTAVLWRDWEKKQKRRRRRRENGRSSEVEIND